MRLLVVCLGNICRSPMAEGWLSARIAQTPDLAGRIEVDSAGLGRWHVGDPPDPRAIATAAAHGIDISGQRARQLRAEDFTADSLILCADVGVLQQAYRRGPATSVAGLHRMLEWAGLPAPWDLPDPYQGGPADFEAVWNRIDEAGERMIGRLKRELGA
ncbi:low molecular weight phosphotyrosine protein phosphatase [Luteimonas gilva]|uniref:protein-tyrosine-phosphatase n=1 Tax=Luteimonas gilva TaxID=2572684 RepID=A0A4U5JXJ1_9GAMM|nr:low molecular weight protein-tyrosine-phosphatase [Luteimonas gilva]TKR33411.1 low molecular weight phosphotyrosine protein phosphatase [Luteimonas gilva]